MTAKPRLQIHIDADTRIAVRKADGLPLILAVRTDSIDVELIFPWGALNAVPPANALAERSAALLTEARNRASANPDTSTGASDVAVQ